MTKTFLSSLLLAGVVGCSPCHSGHYEVDYYEAHTTHDEICIQRDDSGWCSSSIPTSTYHPERCDYSFRCDWTCKTLDQGKAEAHPKHGTLRLVNDTVDSRCGWDGARAWVK